MSEAPRAPGKGFLKWNIPSLSQDYSIEGVLISARYLPEITPINEVVAAPRVLLDNSTTPALKDIALEPPTAPSTVYSVAMLTHSLTQFESKVDAGTLTVRLEYSDDGATWDLATTGGLGVQVYNEIATDYTWRLLYSYNNFGGNDVDSVVRHRLICYMDNALNTGSIKNIKITMRYLVFKGL